ncbi:hypothetical protein MCUN1_001839 [Malassezia cuniculi]|uniref:Hexosyltransferase n=1 Tax=Malassezia cuniculi TaxID=948313 RepID=A0AAF0J697_9BASI|nr:hypothetical protein MCUN1_001839 [Malassezia cuniculi]
MTTDDHFERRQVIRNTYASFTLPHDNETGQRFGNIQVKFVLGRPRRKYADQIAMEMEMHNDIVILDIPETMSSFKTLHYMRWAAQNATVPVLYSKSPLDVRWKLADYVLKADDDTFIMLDELERRLRMAPRTLTYWGYQIREDFMAGELYALSHDLVQYVAASPRVAQIPFGKEDVYVAHWINTHPQRSLINWVDEKCWIYDHPKAGSPYSHGFLFPDEVARIKREAMIGISDEMLAHRGGPRHAPGWSTVSNWKVRFAPPQVGLSAEEQIEALIEGGGRWNGTWVRAKDEPDTVAGRVTPIGADDVFLPQSSEFDPTLGLRVYPSTNNFASNQPVAYGRAQDAFAEQMRRRRMLDGRYGGTIVVHYVKKNVWFYETALALIGRDRLWRRGIGGAGSEWRTPGSPTVQFSKKKDLYIASGH